MMMSTVGYFFPAFLPGNTIPCIIIASLVMWGITLLVIRGVESAAFLNAIVMVCKVAAIAVTLVFGIFLFNAGILTADFWGNVYNNAVAAGEYGPDAAGIGDVGTQIFNCMIIMMWCCVGIEGASVVSARAARKSDVGKATLIGFICLMAIYVGASVLPFGYMPYTEIAALDYPALLYVFESKYAYLVHGSRLGRPVHLHRHHHLHFGLLAVLHHSACRDHVRDGRLQAAARFLG